MVRGTRLVSLSPSVTDTLVAIGAGDELIGVSVFCRPYAPPHTEAIGDYLNVKMDRLEELHPDIVFTSGKAQERLAERLRARGYRVEHIPVPWSLYGIPELIWRVGVTVGRRAEALEKAAEVMEKLAAFRGAAPPSRILYIIDLAEPIAPGAASYAGHALSYLGVRHLYESVNMDWVRVMPPDVRRYRPQLVVYEGKLERPTLEQALGALRRWLILDEWIGERSKVVPVPRDTLAHYGPRITENLERLVGILSGV